VRMFQILPPQTEGFAGFFAAMQLAKSAECLDEQRKSAQIPALQLLKSLDDLDEDADAADDDDDDDDYDYDEDEDEDEEDLDDELGEEEDEDDDLDDEDEGDEDVKPLKM
jgi:hypothetical protein